MDNSQPLVPNPNELSAPSHEVNGNVPPVQPAPTPIEESKKSAISPVVVAVLVTALVVGGGVWLASRSENAKLYTELKSQQAKLKEMEEKLTPPQALDTTVPVGTPEGWNDTPGALNPNLTTYQDPNVPGLRFTYDKSKWELSETQEKLVPSTKTRKNGFKLTHKNNNGKLTFTYDNFTGSFVSDIFVAKKDVVELNQSLFRIGNVSPQTYQYTFLKKDELINKNPKVDYQACISGNTPYKKEDCEKFNNDNYLLIRPDFFLNKFFVKDPRTFYPPYRVDNPNTPNEKIVFPDDIPASFYVSITYTGTNPEEADEIVKQIELN